MPNTAPAHLRAAARALLNRLCVNAGTFPELKALRLTMAPKATDKPTAFAKYRALYVASREAARERLRKAREMRRAREARARKGRKG
jgi:hypothetical protein